MIYGFHGIRTSDGVFMRNTLGEHQRLNGGRARSLGMVIYNNADLDSRQQFIKRKCTSKKFACPYCTKHLMIMIM